MQTTSEIQRDFIQDFGEAYQHFGLPKLMGRIVGLLLEEEEPLSLDEITDRLQVSKGPVSQVMRRLADRELVELIWVPGDRRHFYRAIPDIFGRAFANHAGHLEQNRHLARRFVARAEAESAELSPHFRTRLDQMERFYTLMNRHLTAFLEEWTATEAAREET